MSDITGHKTSGNPCIFGMPSDILTRNMPLKCLLIIQHKCKGKVLGKYAIPLQDMKYHVKNVTKEIISYNVVGFFISSKIREMARQIKFLKDDLYNLIKLMIKLTLSVTQSCQ